MFLLARSAFRVNAGRAGGEPTAWTTSVSRQQTESLQAFNRVPGPLAVVVGDVVAWDRGQVAESTPSSLTAAQDPLRLLNVWRCQIMLRRYRRRRERGPG